MGGDASAAPLVIVGSGPAAFAAAHAYRDRGGRGRVVMLTDDVVLPYERPPLSKDYLRGDVDEGDLPMAEAAELQRLDVETVTSCRVQRLHPARAQVHTADGRTVAYGSCLLATGAEPAPLPVPGGDHPGILHLRTLVDARRLRAAAMGAERAVVVGSGFIGCESAASLSRLGVTTTLVSNEPLPQEGRLGADVGQRIADWLRSEGVELVLGVDVKGIDIARGVRVTVSERADLTGDIVLIAAGVRPRCQLAEDAGVPTRDGRILTDERMRTSVPGVLAAGDVALSWNAAAKRHLAVEHWGEALRMGEVAGATAAGGEDRWEDVPGFWTQIGDRTLKYAAWGDGYDEVQVRDHGEGAFTAWYTGSGGEAVGVLTYEADDDYDRGQTLIKQGARPPG
jgi:3-phenylpropionate/trans-cinnamate dioxygenase ferredoxin reductase subunit